IEHLETKLSETLGAKVSINHGRKGKGKLVISYTNLDELDGILTHIK
ncbi:MAG TPA: chromosome partitioning protein ParB, partial [Idiomarina abyssalis]|nr:chromosome partitioning protein ParB [Idiomarina abyssalis]